MSSQPYIPLYIGDWQRDTNCISLEAEGALLKIIFKLWDSPEKGRLSFSFSQLSILFKKSEENARKIISELHQNGVLDFDFVGDSSVKVESRRILREAAKSLIMSENGKKGGRPISQPKAELKPIKSKMKAKGKQITDIDIDNEYDNVIDLIPESWNKNDFKILLKKWIEKRNKKPDSDLAALRVSELIKAYPVWSTAKDIMTECALEGWAKFVYPDKKPKNPIIHANGHDPRHSETFKFDKA